MCYEKFFPRLLETTDRNKVSTIIVSLGTLFPADISWGTERNHIL
jgi:hypothetical protein